MCACKAGCKAQAVAVSDRSGHDHPMQGQIRALIAGPYHHARLPESHGEEPSCCQEGHAEKQAGTPPLHSDAVHGKCEYTRIELTASAAHCFCTPAPSLHSEAPCCRHTVCMRGF